MARIQRCAGGVVFDDARRLLVVRRANEPGRGRWTIPGGRCDEGESTEATCAREVEEETGMLVRVGAEVGRFDMDGLDGAIYDITDYACEVIGGALRAGDDADEVRWVTLAELTSLPLVDGLSEFLAARALLPD